MNITLWPIERIRPYARNARQIPQQAIDKVAASIHEFGWRQPIVVDSAGVIVCGHTRLLAAQKLGLIEVPIHVADNLTAAQIRAFRLLDNRSHQESRWDEEMLGLEILDLKELGIDLNLTGFDVGEIDDLIAIAGATDDLTDPDSVPEMPENSVSVSGDLWVLGNHRLLCGDSTVESSFERLLEGGDADMVFTDPPYNVNYQQPAGSRAGRRIVNDDLGLAFDDFLADVSKNLLARTKGAIYICMSSSEIDTLKRVFTDAGGHWSTFVIWAKSTFTLGRSDYQRQYEPILYGWRQGNERFWCGARDQGDVWFMKKPVVNDLHPTMKPIELVERAIVNSCRPRALVLDAFGGSGTTIIACQRTGRHARVIEIDPKYVDTAVMRWQKSTGKEAVLEHDDRTFRQVAESRVPSEQETC